MYVRDERPMGSDAAPAVWYLFVGSDAGGKRAASMYSLIGAAKLDGLDPQAYLQHGLERIGEHPINCIDELLLWNVAAQLALPIAEQCRAA